MNQDGKYSIVTEVDEYHMGILHLLYPQNIRLL
jgi:hypothetical protein